MGYDVTYHPMTAREMQEWLFARLPEVRASDFGEIDRLSAQAGLDKKARKDWLGVLAQASAWDDPEEPFEPTYGYALCSAQTFFAPHWYTRGSSFSTLARSSRRFEGLLAPLPASQIAHFPPNPSVPRITANWQSGAWLPPEGVEALLGEAEAAGGLADDFNECFSGGQAEVVLDALRFAKGSGRGILEASDIVEPDPLDLASTARVGNLQSLDVRGLLIYRETVLAQLRAAGAIE